MRRTGTVLSVHCREEDKYNDPINEKVFLFYPFLNPIKSHVHCLGPFLSNCSGDNAFGHGVVCFDWGWQFGKTKFVECNL